MIQEQIQDQIRELCKQIVAEQNSNNLLELVTRLNKLLEEKQGKFGSNVFPAA
jgi:hypothetical protein